MTRGRFRWCPARWRDRWMSRPAAQRRYRTLLAQALDEVARGLRSGASLLTALDEAALSASHPVAGDLREVCVNAASNGLAPALERWAVRRPWPDVRLVVATLTLVADTGGQQASTVAFLADGLHQRCVLADELRAAVAQARLSAVVIAAAPAGFTVVLAALAPGSARYLLTTASGGAMLAGGLALDGIGAWWMTRLARVLA